MPTSYSYNPPQTGKISSQDGYTRVAILCYLWRLPLDSADTRIIREYDEDLNQTTFTVSGLPVGSRPQKLWTDGVEAFGAKLAFKDNGIIVTIALKKLILFNPGWEIEIISPA